MEELTFFRLLSVLLFVVSVTLFQFVQFHNPDLHGGNGSCADSSTESIDYILMEEQGDHITVKILVALFFGILILYGFREAYDLYAEEKAIADKIKAKPSSHYDPYDYFFYRLDYLFSKSSDFKGKALVAVTSLLIFVGGIGVWIATRGNPIECLWTAWTFIADPGTHADSSSGLLRVVALALTLGGMIIFALVIGIVSGDVGDFVERLRKGRSRVVESGHTLILGEVRHCLLTWHPSINTVDDEHN